ENSWAAVFKPGRASRYFDVHAGSTLDATATAYNSVNAWWLAELSRLVYKEERDEIGRQASGKTRNQILSEVGLEETAFFNAGGSQAALVAPSSSAGPQFVVVVFRGTDDLQAWFDFNLDLIPTAWPEGGTVHQGFKEAFDVIWHQIEAALPAGVPTLYAGHSLGGSLATLAASRRHPTSSYTFGSPRAGDTTFGATVAHDTLFRVVNNRDIVTEVPPIGLEHIGQLQYIAHNGTMLVNPNDTTVRSDRLKRDPSFDLKRNLIDRIAGPPQELADHAPVNYVAHLERTV
ncbi:MAG: lipase family protein, partial [Vicinamibacterales bacterium]|nr:lipase family protein [Vicinamibacterales bacterium]